MSSDVRQLVHAWIVDDDSRALSQLVVRFESRVFGLCYRMLGQWQDAEDAVQETFVRMARSLRCWDATREFEPWLLAIAANCCRTQRARRTRQIPLQGQVALDQVALDQVALPATVSRADRRTAEAGELAVQGLAEEIDQALAALPQSWEQACRMFHERQLSYQQIADELGCPVGTVKTWVHRGRKQLLTRLRQREVLGDSACGKSFR